MATICLVQSEITRSNITAHTQEAYIIHGKTKQYQSIYALMVPLHSHHFPYVRILVHRSTAVQFIKKHYRLWVSTQHTQWRIVCYS